MSQDVEVWTCPHGVIHMLKDGRTCITCLDEAVDDCLPTEGEEATL